MNISVKARERIIKLYEFFNMERHRRITAQTNPLPETASKAITPNVTLTAVREWSIRVLFPAESVVFMASQCWTSNRCYLRKRIKCIIPSNT